LIYLFWVFHYAAFFLAACSLVYYAMATVAALRFFGGPKPARKPEFAPVSLLKPVRGVDFASEENFRSFCRQNYPEYEILFAVNDESEPALPLIRELICTHPERQIRVLVGAEAIGSNRKVNKLVRLVREARHEILVLTDGDVGVGPNFLQEVVAPLSDARVGAVTCFYRGLLQPNLWAELEALGTASDFFAGVLVAEWLEGVRFALGAAIATSRSWIARMGGLESIASMHSDDYELGLRIAKAGGMVELSREVVSTSYPAESFLDYWHHQLRWARTVRLSRPASFLGLIFTHGLPWAVLAAVAATGKTSASVFLAGYLLLRLSMAWSVGVRGIADETVRRKWWLIPVRDAIYFAVWIASFASRKIRWGGKEYLMKDKEMTVSRSGDQRF
jgi:ceramide glucosyltransferase